MENSKRAMIEARLEQLLRLNQNRLTPDLVLEDARNKNSPLHDIFEWNNAIAAQKYRLDQARELIRSVKVEVVTSERIISTVRYLRDPTVAGDEQGYVEATTLRSSRDLALEALHMEVGRLTAMVERVEGLASVLDLEVEFKAFKQGYEMLACRVKQAA